MEITFFERKLGSFFEHKKTILYQNEIRKLKLAFNQFNLFVWKNFYFSLREPAGQHFIEHLLAFLNFTKKRFSVNFTIVFKIWQILMDCLTMGFI